MTNNKWGKEYRLPDGRPDWEKIRKEKGRRPTPETRRLPLKAKRQIVRQERLKMTNKEAAKEYGVTPGTYQQYRSCNEGKAIIAAAREAMTDSKRLVDILLNQEIPEQFTGLLIDIDALERNDDHHEAGKLRLKLLEMAGFFDKNQFNVNVDAQNIQITIQGGGNGSALMSRDQFLKEPEPIPEAEYEVIEGDTDRN